MLISRNEGIKKFGSEYLLNKEIEEGRLFKLEKGIYSDKSAVSIESILSFKYKDGVLCGGYALYYHGLTDFIPEVYEIATDRDASKISDIRVKQIFMPKKILHLGAVEESINGDSIRIYNKERTLIELLRNKVALPYDLYKECISNYRKIISTLDIRKIEEYASSCPKAGLILKRFREEVL